MSDQIVFNGTDLSDYCMCRMHRPIMAPVNVSYETIGGRHGAIFRRAKLDAYEIPVELWLRSNDKRDVADLRHTLAALLWTDEPAPLYLPDDPDLYHLAIVSDSTDLGAITDELPGCTISFLVCDPIAYGESQSLTITDTDAHSVTVGGTWESYPTVTSTLDGTTWRITNNTTSEYVEVNSDTWGDDLTSGATLVCDMANERVTIGGSTAGVAIASDFFTIEGTCSITVTGATTTTVAWRQRWL